MQYQNLNIFEVEVLEVAFFKRFASIFCTRKFQNRTEKNIVCQHISNVINLIYDHILSTKSNGSFSNVSVFAQFDIKIGHLHFSRLCVASPLGSASPMFKLSAGDAHPGFSPVLFFNLK